MVYGNQVAGLAGKERTVIGEVDATATGNIAFRIGQEIEAGGKGWHQIGYVVITRDEAVALMDEIWIKLFNTPQEGGSHADRLHNSR